MKKILLSGSFIVATLLSVSAIAAWDNGGVTTQIENVVVLQDGQFYINFATGICDPVSGSNTNDIGWVHKDITVNGVGWSQEGADMLLRTAISAKLSGSTVTAYANNSGDGWGCQLAGLKIH